MQLTKYHKNCGTSRFAVHTHSSTVGRLVLGAVCFRLVAVACNEMHMERTSDTETKPKVEQEPREYRVVLRRDFDEEAENPFEDIEDEPATGDIMWEGIIGPDSADLWEEAGLIEPIEADKYELQERDSDGSWAFLGVFSTSESLQWVLDHSTEPSET